MSCAIAAYCIPLENCPVSSCFFFLFYIYFPYFLSGLSIAYQINPYIKRNLEYISIQAFHFFQVIAFRRLFNTKENSKKTPFLSGLSIAYQINPYIKRNLEYISIQAFHFFQVIAFRRLFNTKENSKKTQIYSCKTTLLIFSGTNFSFS